MTVSWDEYSQYMEKIKNVPNHQPANNLLLNMAIYYSWFTHAKCWFSIVMSVYQRVRWMKPPTNQTWLPGKHGWSQSPVVPNRGIIIYSSVSMNKCHSRQIPSVRQPHVILLWMVFEILHQWAGVKHPMIFTGFPASFWWCRISQPYTAWQRYDSNLLAMSINIQSRSAEILLIK